jgi:hypothetical protein
MESDGLARIDRKEGSFYNLLTGVATRAPLSIFNFVQPSINPFPASRRRVPRSAFLAQGNFDDISRRGEKYWKSPLPSSTALIDRA